MTFGERIAKYRKEKNMTQEALANQLGVTNQAVSKWENDQSYPDIEQLPNIADLFGVTIDALFGRERMLPVAVEQPVCSCVEELPWEDDGKLRMVAYLGHKLLTHLDAVQDMTVTFEGDAVDVECCFNLNCGDVEGNVNASGNVTCNDVAGHVSTNGSVICDDVEGNVTAGGNATCGDVEGSVNAGGSVQCGDVDGDIKAGGNVSCGDVDGSIIATGNVRIG